jgi:hypothetical protein
MAYDSTRDRIVLFGGSSGPAQSETWTFDGSTWQLETPPQSPPGTSFHWMAYDEARDRVVMVSPSAARGEVFEFDGTTWLTIQAPTGPSTTRGGGLAYDSLRGRCVFFAGTVGPTRTWEWDGVTWTLRNAVIGRTLSSGALSFDRARGRMVHSGGFACDFTECSNTNETWEYVLDHPASAAPFGEACAGSSALLGLQAEAPSLPWLGDQLELTLAPAAGGAGANVGFAGSSRTLLGTSPLPITLGALGRPDCALLTSSEIAVPLTAAGGSAAWAIPIPALSSLLGLSFYLQGLTIGEAAPGVIATSNGIDAVIGER